jgi:hypothetical protein
MAESRAAGRATPSGGVRALRSRWARIALVLSVVGPGIITANVDNDAGGIATYSQAGAEFGYSLLWTLIPITFALILVQEMTARMGVVTGKGLSDLIREKFGVKATFYVMVALWWRTSATPSPSSPAWLARWRSSGCRVGSRCRSWRSWCGRWS